MNSKLLLVGLTLGAIALAAATATLWGPLGGAPSAHAKEGGAAEAGDAQQAETDEPFDREALKQHVLRLGQPAFEVDFPAAQDRIYRREKGAVFGQLESLMAFATVRRPILHADSEQDLPFGKLQIPRGEISFVLLNGSSFPDRPPMLSVEEDTVLMHDGEVLVGIVTIHGGNVHVAGRTMPVGDVRLIHLRDPELERPAAPGAGQDASRAPVDRPDPGGSEARADEDDPGNGCWVGELVYTVETNYERQPEPYVATTSARLRLALTEEEVPLREEVRRTAPGLKHYLFRLRWAEYDYVISELPNWRNVAPNPYQISGLFKAGDVHIGASGYSVRPGEPALYSFQMLGVLGGDVGWPERHRPSNMGPAPWPAPRAEAFTTWLAGTLHGNVPDPAGRLPMEDRNSRMRGQNAYEYGEEGVHTYRGRGEWDFRRLPSCPPWPQVSRDDADDCEHERLQAEAKREFLENVQPILDRMAEDFQQTGAREEKLLRQLDQLQGDFALALALAGIGDASWKLLEILGPQRLGASLTPAQARRFEALRKLRAALKDPVNWTASEFGGDAASAAQDIYEMYQRYKMLEALIEGEYEPALEYIDRHMNWWAGDTPLGRNARRFVEVSKSLLPVLRKQAMLFEEITRLEPAIHQARLELEYWEDRYAACQERLESAAPE